MTKSSKPLFDQAWLHEILADDQGGDSDPTRELGEEAFVGVADLLDETMGAQAHDEAGGTWWGESEEVLWQIEGAESGD